MTAASACAAGVGAGWQVAVEVDRPDSSVLALVSGNSIASCQVWANRERTGFGNAATGSGRYPAGSPPTLTCVTGGGAGDKMTFLAGRVPSAGSAVRVVLDGGSGQEATLGGGLWLAWLQQPGEPTAIEALDASGAVIARIADASGVQPSGLVIYPAPGG